MSRTYWNWEYTTSRYRAPDVLPQFGQYMAYTDFYSTVAGSLQPLGKLTGADQAAQLREWMRQHPNVAVTQVIRVTPGVPQDNWADQSMIGAIKVTTGDDKSPRDKGYDLGAAMFKLFGFGSQDNGERLTGAISLGTWFAEQMQFPTLTLGNEFVMGFVDGVQARVKIAPKVAQIASSAE